MRAGPLAVLSIIALLGFATAPSLALEPTLEAVDVAPRECCKVCHKGKACGDSCISRDRECHKPPGCACDESDLSFR